MRVYDIALMFIRAIVALDFIREVASLLLLVTRYAFVIQTIGGAYLARAELATLWSPVVSLVVTAIIFAFSRPLARFAAKLAAPTDAAGVFH